MLPLAILAMISISSCRVLEGVVPTIVPPAANDTTPAPSAIDQSPRIRNLEDVPPTWTPPPQVRSETPIAPVPPAEVVPQPGSQGTHTVVAGDTLAEIAVQYNVTLESLARANNIEDYDHIEVGQVLIIPGF
jgi:LysM repeat protein